jgi:hypothetical protein
MNHEPIKLPMYEEQPPNSFTPDSETPEIFLDPADSNWTEGLLETAAGQIYRVSTKLDSRDFFGTVKTRFSFGRMNYRILPALYAVGEPDSGSPVLVSANYKLSFDSLRRELGGLNLWLLVIDTKGINVWCAAGKGTFGTSEIVRMAKTSGLDSILSHRTLILPQLAAPGVAAHKVRRESGFEVIYGPVRASDIPAFLEAGNIAEPEMRRTQFNLSDRLVLAPVELVGILPPLGILAFFLFLLNLAALLLEGAPVEVMLLLSRTFYDLAPFFIAAIVGIVLVPALLPYIPGRALAWKGWILGVIWAFSYTHLAAGADGWLQTAAYFLTIPAITSFLGMNFTGSTTYTSLSGVIKEMGIALPLIIISAGLGLIALAAAYFT